MSHIIINQEVCKGCGLCVTACPKKLLCLGKNFNSKGYVTAEANPDGCTGCTFCAIICPDSAITVEKGENHAKSIDER